MTLKIGLDVQFIKTERAGRDFSESTVGTAQKRRRERLQFREIKGESSSRPIFQKLPIKLWKCFKCLALAGFRWAPFLSEVLFNGRLIKRRPTTSGIHNLLTQKDVFGAFYLCAE